MCSWSLDLMHKAILKLSVQKLKNAIWPPFWKQHCWQSIAFLPYTHVICYWNLDLIFKVKLKLEYGKIDRLLSIHTSNLLLKFGFDIQTKLKLEPGNWKIQYGRQAAILKVTYLKINRLWPMATNNMHWKFEIAIPKQIWVMLRKPCHLQSPDIEKSNMAARRPFWKWQILFCSFHEHRMGNLTFLPRLLSKIHYHHLYDCTWVYLPKNMNSNRNRHYVCHLYLIEHILHGKWSYNSYNRFYNWRTALFAACFAHIIWYHYDTKSTKHTSG